MTYLEILKELGLDNEHIELLKRTQTRYKNYVSKIERINGDLFESETAPVIYNYKNIYERVMQTGETPNEVIRTVTRTQEQEIDTYDKYNISYEYLNMLNVTKSYYETISAKSFLRYPALEAFDPVELLINMQDKRATEAEYNVLKTYCTEFIQLFEEYSYQTGRDDNYEQFPRLLQAVENLNEIISLYI